MPHHGIEPPPYWLVVFDWRKVWCGAASRKVLNGGQKEGRSSLERSRERLLREGFEGGLRKLDVKSSEEWIEQAAAV